MFVNISRVLRIKYTYKGHLQRKSFPRKFKLYFNEVDNYYFPYFFHFKERQMVNDNLQPFNDKKLNKISASCGPNETGV